MADSKHPLCGLRIQGCKIIVLELKIEEKKFRKAKMEAIEITNRVPLSNQFSS